MKMIKRYFFLFLLIVHGALLSAQTIIETDSVKGVWSRSGSPYYVNSDIFVAKTDSLFIESGVSIIFSGFYSFNIEGEFLAIGTKKDSIFFRFNKTDQNDSIFSNGWKGIKIHSEDTLKKIVFTHCNISGVNSLGGASHDGIGGAISVTNGKVSVEKSVINGNYALVGAAIFCDKATIEIKECILKNNHSVGDGGAIYLSDARAEISSNYILENHSGEFGGGIVCKNVEGVFINDLIVLNKSKFGGALSVINSNLKIINNTIADNLASINGGGIHCSNSHPEIINTILWNNKSLDKEDQVFMYTGSVPVVINSNVQGGKNGIIKFTSLEHNNPILEEINIGEPGFTFKDYILKSGSPCINGGYFKEDSFFPLFDIQGNPRSDNLIDIGAFEFKKDLANEDGQKNNKDEIFSASENINLFPNPNKGEFQINFNYRQENNYYLKITDIGGAIIFENKLENCKGFVPINISLIPGYYLINIFDADFSLKLNEIMIVTSQK